MKKRKAKEKKNVKKVYVKIKHRLQTVRAPPPSHFPPFKAIPPLYWFFVNTRLRVRFLSESPKVFHP